MLGLITLTVVLISVLGVNTIFTAGRNAEQAGNTTLRDQAGESMVTLIKVMAEKNDLEFESARQDIELLARYASNVFSHPEQFNTSAYWRTEDHMVRGREGEHFSTEGDVGSSLVLPHLGLSGEVESLLEQFARLDVLFVPIYESHPNAILIYMVSRNGVARNYPFIDLAAFPANEVPSLDAVIGAPFFAEATPGNNPDRATVWTSEFEELLGLGLVVTVSSPVYTEQGEFVGVVGLDLGVAELTTQIEESRPIALKTPTPWSALPLGKIVVVPSLSLAPAITDRYDPTLPGTTVEEPTPRITERSIAGSAAPDGLPS